MKMNAAVTGLVKKSPIEREVYFFFGKEVLLRNASLGWTWFKPMKMTAAVTGRTCYVGNQN